MVETGWTFAVLFMTIFSVLVVFAFLWLMQLRAASHHDHESPADSRKPSAETSSRPVRRIERTRGSQAHRPRRPAAHH